MQHSSTADVNMCLPCSPVNKMRSCYDNRSRICECGMRAHGKYEMGRILHGTDQISARVIRTLRLCIITEWITARGTGAISLVRHLIQADRLAGRFNSCRSLTSIRKHWSSSNSHWSEIRTSYIHPIPRANPKTGLRSVSTEQTMTSFIIFLFSSLRAYCRSCCCGNAAPLNDSPHKWRRCKTQKRGNTHSSVSPGILNLSRWAFMAVLDSIDLLCTWYFFSQTLTSRQSGTENGWPWFFLFLPVLIFLHLAVRWDRESPVEN